MRRLRWVVAVAVIVALILLDCSPPEPQRGGINVDLLLLAEGSESFSVASERVNGDSVVFTEAMIGVTEVELERLDSTDMGFPESQGNHGVGHNDDEGDSTDLHVEGEFIVDLIDGTSTPDLGFSSITPGMFKEIEIELGRLLPNDNSIFLAFEVVRDSGNLKVEFSSQAEIKLEIDKRKGFEVASNPLNQIMVLLNLDTLFGWINYRRAEVDEDGVIRINETSNRDLYLLIKGRLHNSFEVRDYHEWGN